MESDVPQCLQSALVNLNPAEGRLSAEVAAAGRSNGGQLLQGFLLMLLEPAHQ